MWVFVFGFGGFDFWCGHGLLLSTGKWNMKGNGEWWNTETDENNCFLLQQIIIFVCKAIDKEKNRES